MKRSIIAGLVGAALAVVATTAGAATLDTIKQRGELICGSNTGLAGFRSPNEKSE